MLGKKANTWGGEKRVSERPNPEKKARLEK